MRSFLSSLSLQRVVGKTAGTVCTQTCQRFETFGREEAVRKMEWRGKEGGGKQPLTFLTWVGTTLLLLAHPCRQRSLPLLLRTWKAKWRGEEGERVSGCSSRRRQHQATRLTFSGFCREVKKVISAVLQLAEVEREGADLVLVVSAWCAGG